MRGKLLVVIAGGLITEAKAISPEVCVIDPASRIDLETLIREFVPDNIIPCLFQVVEQWNRG